MRQGRSWNRFKVSLAPSRKGKKKNEVEIHFRFGDALDFESPVSVLLELGQPRPRVQWRERGEELTVLQAKRILSVPPDVVVPAPPGFRNMSNTMATISASMILIEGKISG